MYEQDLYKIIEPIKKTTITRLNRGKKWKYGYDKEHDIVVISKTGKIGEIIKITSTIFFNTFYVIPSTENIMMHYNCISWFYICITNYRG